MNYPQQLDQMLQKVDSKYSLIIAAAKRARQIAEERPELARSGRINLVSAALDEIFRGELTWEKK